jgi:chemotaxis protein methyltransferase CheR
VLCRNLVFTYFDQPLQRRLAAAIAETMAPGAALVLGSHERMPEGATGLERWSARQPILRRIVD